MKFGNGANVERILILGVTGLVGSEVFKQVKSLSNLNRIFVLTRRPLSTEFKDERVQERAVDFDNLDENLDAFSVDSVICALGTTIKRAGSQDEFRKVDYGYPMKIARLAKAKGAKQFLLVSSLGANANSKIFYNRTKGELERDLEKIGFESLVIVRPSILLGQRAEVRTAERIGQGLSKLFPRRWRGAPAERVAAAMIRSIQHPALGLKIIENDEIIF